MLKPLAVLVVLAALLLMCAMLPAQQKPPDLNPVIAKLAEGKTVLTTSPKEIRRAAPATGFEPAAKPFVWCFKIPEELLVNYLLIAQIGSNLLKKCTV